MQVSAVYAVCRAVHRSTPCFVTFVFIAGSFRADCALLYLAELGLSQNELLLSYIGFRLLVFVQP